MSRLFYIVFFLSVILYLFVFGLNLPPGFGKADIKIKDPKLKEVSGMVFSILNKGFLWVHNDGGKKGKVYLIDRKGKTRAVFDLGVEVDDWEDIAIDSGIVKGKPRVYIGDIGDNYSNKLFVYVYRFNEPDIETEKELKVEKITLKYPDGSHDSEALFVDPITKQLYIITKREANPGVYSAPLSMAGGDTITLEKKGKLHIKGIKMLGWVTGADMSLDGSQILVRTYGNVFYWKRKPNETTEKALIRKPFVLPHVKEVQGEAICFSPEGDSFYTVSEGKNPLLNFNIIKLK